ncbi:universal stress protein [Crocosphaera sp. UHCC 0190]|uniref:universal stress protein n=1 Tax=Crocosphaera sp. UHCC 0190 TaxID=3110246 RepID=UPI002B214E59|nr:universal stress protein [Crocosphaera sp. UHCC 0190]MEA5512019.1 universal stress protein [Crocosphaera sp. UHCC 0190]
MTYQKILVPLSHTDDREKVFTQALNLAKQDKSILKLFHCISSDVYITPYGTFTTSQLTTLLPQWQQRLETEQQSIVEWLTDYSQQGSAQGISVEWDWKIGDPSTSIVQMAKTWEADLIMMGRRGLTGLSEMLLGSVSNYVVHHAPCSVLLIK